MCIGDDVIDIEWSVSAMAAFLPAAAAAETWAAQQQA